VRDAARSLTFKPFLRFDGSIDILITPSTCDHLLAALREMLSNLARHAKASAATVTLLVGNEIVLTVADNGSGPPDDMESGSGLRNLSARARALNGNFSFKGATPHGSIATLRIPLADHTATKHRLSAVL
jgi:two-component system sensor histidine kinase DevS